MLPSGFEIDLNGLLTFDQQTIHSDFMCKLHSVYSF